MKKREQQQILEIIQTAKQSQAAGLYADCQECAIAVGEFIESVAGEGTKTVALLEEYCDLLFKAHSGELGEGALRKHLIKIENSVKSELKPTRKEFVFFPYQPSMFDAFESIYLAAEADPDCDVYVVPIPSFEVFPNGTVGGIRDNSDQYPKDIPITNWQEYDIELRCPDIAFIHYAYDGDVSNASVHPDYYSKRLREFCGLLIYVPYFVLSVEVPDYYSLLPGVLNANYVIVQSEKVRQSYIKHYIKHDKEQGWGGKFGKAEEKFIAMGSSKFDKVINTKRENCELPMQWQKLITKPDGSRKTVFLYNTHMFKWIGGGEAYFKKIRHVFETFKNNDDAVLWWRPHPNTEVNFRTKCPQRFGEYKAVVEEYKSEAWGIYDDTYDLHRAIAWSDVYYGDYSSVAELVQVTGKPILLQNINQIKDEPNFSPYIHYIDKTDIWFSLRRLNALFKMDRVTWEPKFVGSFPVEMLIDDAWFEAPLYEVAAECGNAIYFPSRRANALAKYSISDGVFEKFAYKKADGRETNVCVFHAAVAYKEYVYFTACEYPAIVRLDTVTKEIDYYDDWIEPLKKQSDETKLPFFAFPVCVGSSIWLAAYCANIVVEFNMDTQKSTFYEVGEKGYNYNGISFAGEHFWLSPRPGTDTPVIKWSPSVGILKEFTEIYKDDTATDRQGFHQIICCGDFAWVIPIWSRHAYKIDTQTDEISIAEEFEPDIQADEMANFKYLNVQAYGDSIYAYNALKNTLVEYNFITKERREEALQYSEEILAQIKKLRERTFSTEVKSGESFYYENSVANLSDVIAHFSNLTDNQRDKKPGIEGQKAIQALAANLDGTAGQVILDFVKKLC